MRNGQSKEVSPDFHLKGSQGALTMSLTAPEGEKWSVPFGTILDCCHTNSGPSCPRPLLFQVTKGYTWPEITEWGTTLVSLCPVKAGCCLPMQTKAAEHRTDSLKLGPCLGTGCSDV